MKRTYVIKILKPKTEAKYIKNFKYTKLGYRYSTTKAIENADVWYYKKNIEKI